MAEAFPPEVERLASFGRALEGTINNTQEDIDEVPFDGGSPSISPGALPPAKVQLLGLLKKNNTSVSVEQSIRQHLLLFGDKIK